jgi:hypothetical protein
MDMIDHLHHQRRFVAGRMPQSGLIALIVGGVALGIAAGSFTTAALPSRDRAAALSNYRAAFRPDLMETDAATFALAESERGRNWAAQAFPSGLRACPDPTPAFGDGCTAAMATLASNAAQEATFARERPAIAADPPYREDASDVYPPPIPAERYASVIVTPEPRERPAFDPAEEERYDTTAEADPRSGWNRPQWERSYDPDTSSDEENDDR